MSLLAALPSLLADYVVYTRSGIGVVILIVLLVLLWPGPAVDGRAAPRVGLLWPVLIILLVLLVLGFLP